MADGKGKGRPRSGLDTIIASIAEANGCVVVTENEKEFGGIEIINPLRGLHDWRGDHPVTGTRSNECGAV